MRHLFVQEDEFSDLRKHLEAKQIKFYDEQDWKNLQTLLLLEEEESSYFADQASNPFKKYLDIIDTYVNDALQKATNSYLFTSMFDQQGNQEHNTEEEEEEETNTVEPFSYNENDTLALKL